MLITAQWPCLITFTVTQARITYTNEVNPDKRLYHQQQGYDFSEREVNILHIQSLFLPTESSVPVTVLRQVTLVEYKDMWEWVCFLVLGVSASVNQCK